MNKQLPKMTVEKRVSNNAHGIPAPDLSPENMAIQIQEAIQLNQDAIQHGWKKSTLDILIKYISPYMEVTGDEIIAAVSGVMKMNEWKEVVEFVQDDECTEFFNLCLKYCKTQGQPHKKNKGFIDGSGIGYMNAYLKRLKVTLEKAFDVKYFYKVPRPLQYARDNFKGMDLSNVANYIHPGHWSYLAGHFVKFATAVEVTDAVFHLDKNCYRNQFIAACVGGLARSGSLIHYPMDNLIGGKLTTLKEFN